MKNEIFKSLLDFLENVKPTKELARKLAFELEEMQHSLFATVTGKADDFRVAEVAVRDYITDYKEEIYESLPQEVVKELKRLRDDVHDFLNQARYRRGSDLYDEVHKFLGDTVKYSESSEVREICLPYYDKSSVWGESTPNILVKLLADINRYIAEGDSCQAEDEEEDI